VIGTRIKGKKWMTGIFDNTNWHEFARMTEHGKARKKTEKERKLGSSLRWNDGDTRYGERLYTSPLHHSTTSPLPTPLHPSTPAPHVVS